MNGFLEGLQRSFTDFEEFVDYCDQHEIFPVVREEGDNIGASFGAPRIEGLVLRTVAATCAR